MMLGRVGVALAAVAALVLSACGSADGSGEGKVRVVTTLGIFADFVRNVGGDRVEVVELLPPGADPHTYELEPKQVARITDAGIAFVNGLGFEEAILPAIERNLPDGAPLVELSEGLEPLEGGDEQHGNPHFWLDVTYAMRYVERIRDGLARVDPEGAPAYEANAAHYLDELAALDAEIEEGVLAIPAERRKLVTFHDSFPYFGRRYGFEIVAVVVQAPGREPSAADIAVLGKELKAEGIPTVYSEPQINARILELAAEDAGIEVRELYSDSFSGDVDTYVEMMRFNLRQLREGLGEP